MLQMVILPGTSIDSPADPAHSTAQPCANPLDYSAKIDAMLSACRDLGVTPEEGAKLISDVMEIGLERFRCLAALYQQLEDARIEVEDLTSLHKIAREFALAIGAREKRAAALARGC